MIIKKATIKRLRAIREEKTFEFTPGLNIIKGNDNEAGKSSLRIAITKALFQDPAVIEEDIDELTSWGTDEPWEVSLDLEDNSGSYRITKSLRDRTCELIGTGERVFVARNINTISERIGELTGCPSEVFFESTACIGQDELIKILPSRTTAMEKQDALGMISKRMQSQLSGMEGIDIDNILSQLYRQANREDADGPYAQLQQTKERIYQLRGRKLDEEKKINDIIGNRKKLYSVRQELDKLNRELPEKQEILHKNKKVIELRREIARDKSQYTVYQKARELKSAILRIEGELLAFSAFATGEEQIEHLNSVRVNADNLVNLKAKAEDERVSLDRKRPPIWTLLAGLILIGVSITLGVLVSPFLGSLAIAGILLAAYWMQIRRSWKNQLDALTQKINELEEEQKRYSNEETRLLTYFGAQDYPEYLKRLAEYRSKTESGRDLTVKLDILLNGEEWKTYAEKNSELDRRVTGQIKELEQLGAYTPDPATLQSLEDEIRELEQRKNDLEQERGGLEKYFSYTDIDQDHMVEIEEDLFRLEEQKIFWEKRREIYNTTYKIMADAQKQTFSRASDILQKEIGRYIDIITDGKYNQVKINENDMSISTISPEKGEWVDVSLLSRATQDQFYICARFALARLITEGKRPPFLLDDPFVNFHARRLRQSIPLIQEIARENQILLFTCSDAYDYLGNVITLE